jgi:hypothetical protein
MAALEKGMPVARHRNREFFRLSSEDVKAFKRWKKIY